MKRVSNRRWMKALRREYVRERGRHDRCWDTVNYGKRGLRNAMRREMRGAMLALRRDLVLHMYRCPMDPLPIVEWPLTPRVAARRARA